VDQQIMIQIHHCLYLHARDCVQILTMIINYHKNYKMFKCQLPRWARQSKKRKIKLWEGLSLLWLCFVLFKLWV